MEDPLSPWGLIALALLLAVNAFFVAAEYALVSVRRTRIDELIQEGSNEAKYTRLALDNLDRYIAVTQLGITMAGIALGWIGEPALSALVTAAAGLPLQFLDPTLRRTLTAAISFILVTFASVVLSELVPKSITLKYSEQVALRVSRILVYGGAIFRPFIWALNTAAGLILRLLRVEPVSEIGSGFTVQELKLMAEASEKIGIIQNMELEMLNAVFDFGDLTAREIMVPRTEIAAIDADASFDKLVHLAIAHPHSHYPVHEGDLDHVVGVAHLKDIVRIQHDERRSATVRGLMREASFVPDTLRLDALLRLMQSKKQHLVIVLDEYSGTAGLVGLDDLIGEIVGEVRGPFNKSSPQIQYLPDGSALIEGLMRIEDVNDRFELNLHDENYGTIAGFVLGKLGRLATVGDTVEAEGVKLRVELLEGRRIARLSLRKLQPERTPSASAS